AEDGIRDLYVTGVQTCALPIRSEEHTSELQSRRDLVCRIIRSEEHTSELQSRRDLVCRLLLEKKKKTFHTTIFELIQHHLTTAPHTTRRPHVAASDCTLRAQQSPFFCPDTFFVLFFLKNGPAPKFPLFPLPPLFRP